MKKIVLILVMCFLALPSFAYDYVKNGFPPLVSSANYNQISDIEQAILGKRYDNQNINIRLERLEKTLFNKTFPKLSYENRIHNIVMNYRNGTSFSGLSKLERQIFDEIYESDTPENRISRLEQQIMGTVQSGELLPRYKNLQRVVPSYRSNRMARQYGGLPLVRTGGGWRGIAGSLGNFLNSYSSGYPTGFTPPVYYSPYQPYTNYSTPDFQRGYYSNRGWGYNNMNYGSGTGVHILD